MSGETGLQESSSTAEVKPDVAALMTEIRDRIAADVEKYKDQRRLLRAPTEDGSSPSRAIGELLASEELRYVNTHYAFSTESSLDVITSHRPGILGALIVAIKRKLVSYLCNSLLRPYFEREREYHANVVRFMNECARYIDARDAANNWELSRKIEGESAKLLEELEKTVGAAVKNAVGSAGSAAISAGTVLTAAARK